MNQGLGINNKKLRTLGQILRSKICPSVLANESSLLARAKQSRTRF